MSQIEKSISVILIPHLENLLLISLFAPNLFIIIICHFDYQNYKNYCVDLKHFKHDWKYLAATTDLPHY